MLSSERPDPADWRVSIVVLTCNRKRLLETCLHSLFAQTYPREKLEILVIDDGSRDGTREVVGKLKAGQPHLRYVFQSHAGISAARNNGIRNATGNLIAFVADDYILKPTYAATMVRFFEQTPAAEVVRFQVVPSRSDLGSRISHFYYHSSVLRRLYESPGGSRHGGMSQQIRSLLHRLPSLEEEVTDQHMLEASGAAGFKRHVFMQVGLFDESLYRAEDTDFTDRLRAAGISVYYVPHHHVQHQYGPFVFDSISKCFKTGFNRYGYYRKRNHPIHGAGLIRTLVFAKVGFLSALLWRARLTDSFVSLLLYMPFVFLFETANKLGFLAAWLYARHDCMKRG